jgi:NitT/TauT family transport system substrate-binding protein
MHEENTEDPDRAAWAQGVHNAVIKAQIHLAQNRHEMAELLSRDGAKYLPFPKDVIERAMIFYDPAYYNNPLAIKHPEWGMDRINFQAWPYRSATELVVTELKETLVTGENAFLKELTPQFVADDLVNYRFVKQALELHPAWKDDNSVPRSGDPFSRTEIVQL